jgi:hypothetical protein
METAMDDNAPQLAGSALVRRLAWALAAAAVVTGGLVLFGVEHAPDYAFSLFGSPGHALSLKSKVATAILGLALVQLLLALWMLGRLPGVGTPRHPVRRVHRILGIVLFLATLPVAIHCMIAYGVQTTSARVTVHSLAGCFFYGAFVAKVLLVRSRQMPGWILPVAGGVLIAVIGVVWYTSALWFFNGSHLPV